MRDGNVLRDGILLTILILMGGAGIYLWISHVDPSRPLDILKKQAAANEAEASPKAQAFPPQPRKTPAPKRVSSSAPIAPKPVEVVVQRPAPVAVAPPPPKDPPPFPVVEQIEAGSHEDAITSAYGSPTVYTMTSNKGHVIENLIYKRPTGRSAAFIQLEDGKVSAAYTKPEPPTAEGLSVPRPKPEPPTAEGLSIAQPKRSEQP